MRLEDGVAALNREGEGEERADDQQAGEGDQIAVTEEELREQAQARVLLVGLDAQGAEDMRDVEGVLVRRRVGAGVVAGAALEAEVCHVEEVAVIELTPA